MALDSLMDKKTPSQPQCHRTTPQLLLVCSLCTWWLPLCYFQVLRFKIQMSSLLCTLSLFLLIPQPCFNDDGTPSTTVPEPSLFLRITVWHQEALTMSTRTSFLALSCPCSRQCCRVDCEHFSKGDFVHCFVIGGPELILFYCFVFSDEAFCVSGWLWTCNVVEDDLDLLILLFPPPCGGIAGMLHHTWYLLSAGIKTRAWCMLGKHSINWAKSLASV